MAQVTMPRQVRFPVAQLALRLLFACLILLLLSGTVADVDLWGHVRYGLDNLESRRLVTQDHYSYLTGDVPWINHEWLSETLFAIAWVLGRSVGLTLLKLSVAVAAFALIGGELARRGANLLAAGPFLLLGVGVSSMDFSTVRPQIFSVLMLIVLLLILLRVDEGRRRWLIALPPTMAVWANLHGGFLAGLGVMGVWGIVYGLRHRDARLQVLLALLAATLATFINPYGPRLLLFLLQTATTPRPEIWEWNPVSLMKPFGLLYLALSAMSVLGLIYGRARLTLQQFILFGLMAFLPLTARRHLSLYAVTALLLAGPGVANWVASWPLWRRVSSRTTAWIGSGALVVALTILPLVALNLGRIVIQPSTPMPARIVSALKQVGASGRMIVEFSWGEYVLWHLGPQVQVSIDGRRETVYSPRIYEQNLSFLFGQGKWSTLLDNGSPDMVLLLRGGATYNLMSMKAGWKLALEDGAAALFVRDGSLLADKLQPALLTATAPRSIYQFP